MKQFFLASLIVFSILSFSPNKKSDQLATLPKGSIIGWASRANIPNGWAVCNGANGTPNLVGRFPMGITNSSEIGTLTGTATHHHEVSGDTGIPDHLAANGDERAFNKSDGDRVHHTHHFDVMTTEASSIPPATKIIFIMKL